jgi:Family of unknown function (DUF6941)
VNLEWMMLANHAEARDGLLYISGGTWDSLNVQGPIEGGPPNAVAIFQGFLIVRLNFHATEVPSEHAFDLVVIDEDGGEHGKAEGQFRVEKIPGVPPEWGQGFNMIAGLSGLPLPKFGKYAINLLVDGSHLGERPFRVLKLY